MYEDTGKILLVLDNARAHLSKELKPFLDANEERHQLQFLTPYSADLNPNGMALKIPVEVSLARCFFRYFQEVSACYRQLYGKIQIPIIRNKNTMQFCEIIYDVINY